jgi:plasmid stabilization system protein ParE
VKRFTLIIAPKVQEEITAQVLRIAQDSVENAIRWENRLRSAVEGIGNMPGYSFDEDATRRLGYPIRKYVFEGTYLIHYWVDDAAGIIKIINFRHGARLPRTGEP